MLSIIYPYRNRDINRVKRSLDSLMDQTEKDFKVYFVNYGSEPKITQSIEKLIENYDFIDYRFYPTNFQPWNKSRALNSVIKDLKGGFCFVADVDVIFHNKFVALTTSLQDENTSIYFKLGFLNQSETNQTKEFSDYKIDFESTFEVTGLTMFPVKALQDINGFDEFYHFWGAEDTDVHVRLKNNGIDVVFYEKDIMLLHQWHESYRSKEVSWLTKNLQVRGIVKLNHQHYQYALSNKITKVNTNGWGKPINTTEFDLLNKFDGEKRVILNHKSEVDHLLYVELPQVGSDVIGFIVKVDNYENSLKYKAKKSLGKKVSSYYSMKEVNDLLLMHIISFYRDYTYNYKVFEKEKTIQLTIFNPKKK